MNIKIRASDQLDHLGRHDIILLGSKVASKIGKKQGDMVSLKSPSGESFPLRVSLLGDTDRALVSRGTYRKIREGTYVTTLGCDPEFLFINWKGRICPASSFLKKEGQIGNDGPLGELRPDPGVHEDEVVDNLRTLIKRIPLVLEERFGRPDALYPEAHSERDNYALGFHVHLGAPKEVVLFASPGSYNFVSALVRALDYYVGIPSLLVEDNNRRRLGNGQYGGPGDWRVSQCTVEYRTPGGFNLRHPDYTRGLLALSLCVSKSIFSWAAEKSISWSNLDRVSAKSIMDTQFGVPHKLEVSKVFVDKGRAKAFQHLPKIISGLEKMEFYAEHKSSINRYLKFSIDRTRFTPQILKNW